MNVFLTGSTGYLGRGVARMLLARGHTVRALARPDSVSRAPTGCEVVTANALDAATYRDAVRAGDTFIHLVGVSHPAPWKAEEFRRVDLASVRAAADAASSSRAAHIVYVSVAHPAPVMKAYTAIRAECESIFRATGLPATFLRPWYVLGPGHWWPLALIPAYKVLEALPSTRDTARRLGLVRHPQMVAAICDAAEHPPAGVRLVEVPEIRAH
jgi:uncharacterized protein YbjT (DUF2867 family)